MRLADALRLDRSARLALVGAGGKTAALFCLGRQLSQPAPARQVGPAPVRPRVNLVSPAGQEAATAQTVFLAATTHLATDQLVLADRHFILRHETDLELLSDDLPGGVLLFTGHMGDDERTAGLSVPLMEALHRLAGQHGLPLLVEADGSRRRLHRRQYCRVVWPFPLW